MPAREFRDDDPGYLSWIAAHPSGYVINIRRGHNPSDARVHLATCRWISGENQRGGPWTGSYVKVCADEISQLELWAHERTGQPIRRCGTCHRAPDVPPTGGVARPGRTPERGAHPDLGHGRELLEDRADVRGPEPDGSVVEVWADDYVHFQNRPEWQDELRHQILARVGALVATEEDVLHATFFGSLPPRTDVENLLLYNFGSFSSATRFGVRFELGSNVPPAPDARAYRFGYRYELAPRTGRYVAWTDGRRLVSFDWIELAGFGGEKICEQVWLSLARAEVAYVSARPREPSAAFSARFTIRAPGGRVRGVAGLVKGIFDGAISAFQAHTDGSDLPELTLRAARHIAAAPEEIALLLGGRRRAVLGAVPNLVHRRGAGIQWNPADDFCVAGELLAEPARDSRWALKGEILEVALRDS